MRTAFFPEQSHVTLALLRPLMSHAFEIDETLQLFAERMVEVRQSEGTALMIHSRVALDACSQYQIECSKSEPLSGSRIRITSCKHRNDGMYEIGAEMCAEPARSLAA